ncbi:MAG: hypothetical protein AAF205_07610 [Pseudomonadota bacterium]
MLIFKLAFALTLTILGVPLALSAAGATEPDDVEMTAADFARLQAWFAESSALLKEDLGIAQATLQKTRELLKTPITAENVPQLSTKMQRITTAAVAQMQELNARLAALTPPEGNFGRLDLIEMHAQHLDQNRARSRLFADMSAAFEQAAQGEDEAFARAFAMLPNAGLEIVRAQADIMRSRRRALASGDPIANSMGVSEMIYRAMEQGLRAQLAVAANKDGARGLETISTNVLDVAGAMIEFARQGRAGIPRYRSELGVDDATGSEREILVEILDVEMRTYDLGMQLGEALQQMAADGLQADDLRGLIVMLQDAELRYVQLSTQQFDAISRF